MDISGKNTYSMYPFGHHLENSISVIFSFAVSIARLTMFNETKQLAQGAIQSFLRFSGYTHGPAETIDYNALVSDYP
jgi:hypothetical protein